MLFVCTTGSSSIRKLGAPLVPSVLRGYRGLGATMVKMYYFVLFCFVLFCFVLVSPSPLPPRVGLFVLFPFRRLDGLSWSWV